MAKQKKQKIRRITIADLILDYFGKNKVCLRSLLLAKRIDKKTNSVRSTLSRLKKQNKVGCYKRKYWGLI
jgi:hypothetical protein